jgi:hypothetical protein
VEGEENVTCSISLSRYGRFINYVHGYNLSLKIPISDATLEDLRMLIGVPDVDEAGSAEGGQYGRF